MQHAPTCSVHYGVVLCTCGAAVKAAREAFERLAPPPPPAKAVTA